MFAHLLHLRPADVDALTVEDFDTFTDWIDTHQRQLEGAARPDA